MDIWERERRRWHKHVLADVIATPSIARGKQHLHHTAFGAVRVSRSRNEIVFRHNQ